MKLLAPYSLATAMFAMVPFGVEPSTVNASRVKDSLVQITMENEMGEAGVCTGFVVDPGGRIATAAHCTEGVKWIKVDGLDTRVIKTKGWVSILEGIPGRKPPLQLTKKKPEVLETVWAFGNAHGWGFFVFERKVAHVLFVEDAGHNDVFVDGGLPPGQSGGPIVNATGEVVAINQMTFGAMSMGCDTSTIFDALK